MNKLSIVGLDYLTEEHVVGYYNAGDRMRFSGKMGSLWVGLLGFVVGSGFFFIPGIGPLSVVGPLVSMIVGSLEGGVVVGGLSVLAAGLYSLGIPKASIANYETALKSGHFMEIAHDFVDDAIHAKEILNCTKPETLEHHQ